MITIKNPDKETVYGSMTVYEDVADTILEDLNCPCCDKPMTLGRDRKITGQNSTIEAVSFNCNDCSLSFEGYIDYYYFEDIEAFHSFVKGKLNV